MCVVKYYSVCSHDHDNVPFISRIDNFHFKTCLKILKICCHNYVVSNGLKLEGEDEHIRIGAYQNISQAKLVR